MSKTKSRLGRGLSSLISMSDLPVEREIAAAPVSEGAPDVAPPTSELADDLLQVPLDAITPNPHQPRRQLNEQSIAGLVASIRATGLIQPIVVRRVGDGYQLIAGERRWRAAAMAGLPDIPVVVRNVDSTTQAQMALIENIQREDLNPIDRAAAYRTLMTQLGMTQAELAARMGEDRSSVANYLRLLELSEPVRAMVVDGRLTAGHAKLLAGVPDIVEQQRLAALVVSDGLSVRSLERLLQEGTPTSKEGGGGTSAHFRDLEKSLTGQLGMRIQVRSAGKDKKRGRLVIHYASLEQFDDLLGRLGLKVE